MRMDGIQEDKKRNKERNKERKRERETGQKIEESKIFRRMKMVFSMMID